MIPEGICSKCKEDFMNCKCEEFHPNIEIKVGEAKSWVLGGDKPSTPRLNVKLIFDEKCAICDTEIPNGTRIIRMGKSIICFDCVGKIRHLLI